MYCRDSGGGEDCLDLSMLLLGLDLCLLGDGMISIHCLKIEEYI